MIISGPASSGRATCYVIVQQVPCIMHHSSRVKESITLRTTLKAGDIGTIVYLHGILYARQYGFDHMFEAYVAGPLSEFAHADSERERIWVAERDGQIVGCIAIVAASPDVAQLRWFLVHPDARGAGLGRRLLDASVAFSREQGYHRIILWTVSALEAAAHLYRAVGFRKVEEKPEHSWGTDVVEEKYEMELSEVIQQS
jgi:N-acetylglutamate synthase-like GNAT family acetyltransferase